MKNGTCPKCGMAKVLACVPVQAEVGLRGSTPDTGRFVVRLEQPVDPAKWVQTTRTEVWTFHAWICGACGYTEFYADDCAGLYEACQRGWR